MSYCVLGLVALFVSSQAYGDALYQPPGPNLTMGNVAHGHGLISSFSNPAAPASKSALPGAANHGAMLAIGAGAEFGDLNQLFELYDKISEALANGREDEDGGDGVEPPDDGGSIAGDPTTLPTNPTLDNLINNNPEFQEWFDVHLQLSP